MNKKSLSRYISNQLLSLGGLLIIVITSFIIFKILGYNLKLMITTVIEYSKHGITFFGLPDAHEFAKYSFLFNRFWILGAIMVFALLYYFRKIDIFEAILLSFAFSLGVAKILPNYLIWIVPLLLITNRLKLSALVNLIFTSFLLLWYMNPYTPIIKVESMGTFATLNGFSWLMPPTLFIEKSLVPFLFLMGNYIIPFCSLFVVIQVLISAFGRFIRKTKVISYTTQKTNAEKLDLVKNGYLKYLFYFWFFILSAFVIVNTIIDKSALVRSLNKAINEKFNTYDLHQVNPYICIGNYKELSLYNLFNIVFIIFFAAIVWSVYNYFISVKLKSNGSK
jgi:hypothetical protein